MAAIGASYLTIGGLILTGQESAGVMWITQTVDGLGGPGGTLAPIQKPRAPGAWAGLSYSKPRTVAFAGHCAAPTPAQAVDAVSRLNAAVTLAATQLGIVQPGLNGFLMVNRDGDIHISWVSDTAFQWSVQVVALDPRKFGTPLVGTTNLPASSGGLTWPHAWPETWAATTISGSITLTNLGNTTGTAVLRIDGPATGPQISHQGVTGGSITFSSTLVLGSGEWLTINQDTRQVLGNDQSNRSQYVTTRGWSGFDPGVNTWSFTASTYNVASMLTVTATPAWN